ncbi:MAG: hypothetical protein ACLSDQ_08900 [Adlercreutzia equolifaciens]
MTKLESSVGRWERKGFAWTSGQCDLGGELEDGGRGARRRQIKLNARIGELNCPSRAWPLSWGRACTRPRRKKDGE